VQALLAAREIQACFREQHNQVLTAIGLPDAEIGIGIGIDCGNTNFGEFGKSHRDLTAVGTVVNLAARLCAQAADNQILIDRKVLAVVDPIFLTEPAGEFMLKGLHRLTAAFNVCGVREAETS